MTETVTRRERHRLAAAAWNARNPGYWRRKRYGITEADYEALWTVQGGRCAICWRPAKAFSKGLSVDHDHATGRVRGLLCPRCNTDLEVLETPGRLAALRAYLGGPSAH